MCVGEWSGGGGGEEGGGRGSISLVPTPRTPPHERVLGMRLGGYILVFMLYFLPIYMYKAHSISHLYIHWMSI